MWRPIQHGLLSFNPISSHTNNPNNSQNGHVSHFSSMMFFWQPSKMTTMRLHKIISQKLKVCFWQKKTGTELKPMTSGLRVTDQCSKFQYLFWDSRYGFYKIQLNLMNLFTFRFFVYSLHDWLASITFQPSWRQYCPLYLIVIYFTLLVQWVLLFHVNPYMTLENFMLHFLVPF